MTGLELFYEKAKENNLKISEADISKGEKNGNITLTNNEGRTTTQNLKSIAEIYGTLTFFHFDQESAMNEIFNMIELSFFEINS